MENKRIRLIDSLRGLALSGILLLHHIEHFDFFKKPEYDINWLVSLDQWVWNGVFLLFARKSFALFSLLFGMSYWIMYENRKLKGESYFSRHIWRMILLFLFGMFHTIFFRGDILSMYAPLGLLLVFTPILGNRGLVFVSAILLVDPIRSYDLISYLLEGTTTGDYKGTYPQANANQYLSGSSFWELVKFNFTSGIQISWIWTWNVGRLFTILGLFFFGVYLGKTRAFTSRALSFWYWILGMAITIWILSSMILHLGQIAENESFKNALKPLMQTYTRLGMMFFFLSLVVILWRLHDGKIWIKCFSDFGRMGLTNYILMSMIGAILYYGWGLALHQYCGATITLGIGIIALVFQMKFSSWWLNRYSQGPLEKLWRKATWLKLWNNS